VRAAGGEIYGIVSQQQWAADQAQMQWKINFPLISDPPCAAGVWMNKEGIANIEIDVPFAQRLKVLSGGEEIPGGEYEVGTYQPAVVALDSNFQTLFSWSSVARASNIGGAAVNMNCCCSTIATVEVTE
jgi:hypothetical protein